MDGDGAEAVEERCDTATFELPAVLVQLDTEDPATQRQAVRTIKATIDDEPTQCLPTVPKLRELLGEPAIDCHEEIAHCLAVFAEESPDDVAPSVAEIVAFVSDNETHPATQNLLRCLEAIAVDRPDAVLAHVEAIVDAIETPTAPPQRGLGLLATLSIEQPAAIEPAVPLLSDALAADPETNGPAALPALGRIARSDATAPPLAFVGDAVSLIDHDDATLRNNAIGCLGDVAHQNPAAIEAVCPQLATALDCDDPNTRANAAVTIARVAAGAESAVEPVRDELLELLADDHARVRTNACLALGYGSVSEAADRLDRLARGDPNQNVRERASWAVDRLPDRAADSPSQ